MTIVDVVDVDAAGGDVGGDQHRELAGDEVGERPLPQLLAQVAVDGRGVDALGLEALHEAVGAALGADEHQGASAWLLAIAAATFTLSISWTRRNRCSISSTVTSRDATSWRTGSFW